MKMRPLTGFLLICAFLFLLACQQEKKQAQERHTDPNQVKQPLEKANRYLVVAEEEQIEDFIRRYGWDMTKTGTGLRYMIYDKGTGPKVEHGKIVSLDYELKLLTGDLVYSSDKDGLMTFQVGRGGVPSGIEEGIKYLSLGDKAKFILPSHLGFGLLGDDKLIPSRAVLVYDIKVIDLQ